MRFLPAVASLSLAGALTACTPTYNWREVRFDAAPLVVLLPCKPDEGVRTVPLGGRPAAINMKGCEAGGVTFAVAWARADDAAGSPALLAAWKVATLANLRATEVKEADFPVPGAQVLPGAVRMSASGLQPDGTVIQAHAAWFAQGTQVYQALAIAPLVDAQAADTFLAGMRLP